jgi:hypothetical protein
MDEELLRQLPEEYARLADRRGVMHEAAELVVELHQAVTQLGDVIARAGLLGRDWRSPEAELSLLSDELPAMTVDELITHLAEFAASTGPDRLHGDRAAIAVFSDEAANLYGLLRSLHAATQRTHLAHAHERGDLPIEAAFGNVRVVAALEQVTHVLGDLVALAPFMRPLSADEWQPMPPPSAALGAEVTLDPVSPAAPPASAFGRFSRLPHWSGHHARQLEPAPTAPLDQRPASVRQALERMAGTGERRVRAFAHGLHLSVRLAAILGLILLLATGALLLEVTHVGQAQPRSTPSAALAISPARLVFACAPRAHMVELTLKNATTRTLSWQAHVPTALTLSPAHGSLAAGRSVALRVGVRSTRPGTGTLTITGAGTTLSVPYTIACH